MADLGETVLELSGYGTTEKAPMKKTAKKKTAPSKSQAKKGTAAKKKATPKHLAWINRRARELKAKNPQLGHTEATSQASAEYREQGGGSTTTTAPKKSPAKSTTTTTKALGNLGEAKTATKKKSKQQRMPRTQAGLYLSTSLPQGNALSASMVFESTVLVWKIYVWMRRAMGGLMPWGAMDQLVQMVHSQAQGWQAALERLRRAEGVATMQNEFVIYKALEDANVSDRARNLTTKFLRDKNLRIVIASIPQGGGGWISLNHKNNAMAGWFEYLIDKYGQQTIQALKKWLWEQHFPNDSPIGIVDSEEIFAPDPGPEHSAGHRLAVMLWPAINRISGGLKGPAVGGDDDGWLDAGGAELYSTAALPRPLDGYGSGPGYQSDGMHYGCGSGATQSGNGSLGSATSDMLDSILRTNHGVPSALVNLERSLGMVAGLGNLDDPFNPNLPPPAFGITGSDGLNARGQLGLTGSDGLNARNQLGLTGGDGLNRRNELGNAQPVRNLPLGEGFGGDDDPLASSLHEATI